MKFEKYYSLLKKHGQEHILQFWEQYSEQQKIEMIKQIDSIDFQLLTHFISLASNNSSKDKEKHLELADTLSLNDKKQFDSEMFLNGEGLLRSGKVGAFLVAGGQGSRLGFDGPKGAYPITPIKRKTLFQLHAEKILTKSMYIYSEALLYSINIMMDFIEKSVLQ